MEWSKYNTLYKSKNNYFIYNSLSGFFAELDKDNYDELKELEKNPEFFDTKELKETYLNAKIITKSNKDDFYKLKSLNTLSKNNVESLSLTIAPTQACNFACTYCYEENRPNYFLTNTLEDKLIQFINKYPFVKLVNITWYGGEPLMNINSIISLSQKIIDLGLQINSQMITNGFLLTEQNLIKLKEINMKRFQITIDGPKHIHDKNRPLINGEGTYDKIINNIKQLYTIIPDAHISLRVNINNDNKVFFEQIYREFTELYKNHSINVYPGIIDDNIESCKNVDSCNMNRQDVANFRKDLYLEHKINLGFYSKGTREECMARKVNAFVVDARGFLYKCYLDIGKEDKIIGDIISGKITNSNLLFRYLSAADPFDNQSCKQCKILPICEGGCAFTRIHNEYFDTKKDTCSIFKGNINSFLKLHYDTKEN